MTGFDSKRQASLDTLDHIGYQARPSRPDELAHPDPWREALDSGLVCAHIGTVESFPTAQAALDALIIWHVQVAIDPTVSAAAQALVDRGRAVAEPLSDEQIKGIFGDSFAKCADPLKLNILTVDFARAIEAAHGIGIKRSAA